MTNEAHDAENLDRLAQAYVEQSRRGESPSIESVANAHPALADAIRDLFPVLALVEGLKVDEVAPERRPPLLPERIAGYARGPELGRGGMGTVYEGRRVGVTDGPERVAFKVIHAHLLEHPEYVARFLHEAEAGRRVAHENVVQTLATGVVVVGRDEVPYILLEHVEGQNLRALLREVEVVPERLCRHVGIRLADALAAIHAAGLVHRDVKPENVVITVDETVKLMDLGVAVLQDRLQRLSHTGQFVGSLLYAAPGQIAGEAPNPSWDLHALGILLYELATGRHPARNAGLRWLRANESTRTALTRRDALAELSPFFAALIENLLSVESEGFLATAAAVRDVLSEGETSPWWTARRTAATTPSTRLRGLARPTAFYGRKDEWRLLDRALATANEGRGRVVLLEGEAGIGKSRLLYEWASSHRGTQAAPRMVLLTHGPGDAGGDEPQLAAALAQILGDDDLEERLAALLASRVHLAPGLARRLRGEPRRPGDVGYDTAWVELLQALARERPILLVSEDLHFASAEDVDRFSFLARGARTHGLLVVGTFRVRPEQAGIRELDRLEHVTHLVLEGLDTAACRQLLLEASAGAPRLGESVQSLAERSDRNPMLLLELVLRARHRAGTHVSGETTVPESIRGLLAARIAVLDSADRELLETAACQGYEFDPVVVAEAAGRGRIHALKCFARMEHGHQLLRATGRSYRFQHHLVQEVLYEDLHPALREAYHAAIGAALESTNERPSGAGAVALCTHFLKGDLPLRARPHLREAMEHLEWRVPSYAASERIAESALAIDDLLEGADRAFALFVRGRARVDSAHLDEALAALDEALALARAAGDGRLEIDVLKTLSWLARRRGDPDFGVPYLERAATHAHELGDVGNEAMVIGRIGVIRMDQERYEEADALSRRAFEVLGESDDGAAKVRLTGDLAALRIFQGRLDEARALLEEVAELAHGQGDSTTEYLNAQDLGRLAFRCGRFEAAAQHALEALDLGRHLGMHHRDAFLLQNLGRCLEKIGRWAEALRYVEEAVEIARREDNGVQLAGSQSALSKLQSARGELAAALDAAVSARTTAADLHREDMSMLAAIEEADVLSLLGRFSDAERTLEHALAERTGELPPVFRVAVEAVRARLLEHQGRHEDAYALYTQVAELARRGALLGPPHAFHRARARLRAGHPEGAEAGFREAFDWARESGTMSLAVLSQVYLAALPGGDPLAARIALEQHGDRLTAAERVEAHLALWEIDGVHASLEAAHHELERLLRAAPPEDRERMRTAVDLFRQVSAAWATQPQPPG